MKKIFLSLILLVIGGLNITIFNLFAYEGINNEDTQLTLDSKDFSVGGSNYTLYYSTNHNVVGLTQLNSGISEFTALNEILSNANININNYILTGNNLTNYGFSTDIKDFNYNGYTFTYFLEKYSPSKIELMNSEPFTTGESDIIISHIVNGIFSGFNQISNNISTLENIETSMSSKLFLIKDNDVQNVQISDSFLNNIYSIFSLEFSNKVNSHLQYYYTTKENLFGTKKQYLVLDYNDISGSYTGQLDLINQNYNNLVDIVNTTYTTEESNNIDNNIFGIHTDINNRVISAKSYAQTDYPNILISTTKTNLFTDLNSLRGEIITDLNNYRDYLLNKKAEEEAQSNTGGIDYTDGISTSSGTIDFEYTGTGTDYNPNSVGTGITDYNITSGEDALYNLEDFVTTDSREIISKINNYNSTLGEKVDSREDYGLALANNIEKYNKLTEFLSGSTNLNNELFVDSVNFNILLKGDIKDEFVNINDSKTVRDVSLQNFNDTFIDSNTSTFLLRNELVNYGKLMMNNQFISSSITLPSTSKVNNDTSYKNYLKGDKGTYFNNYNKNTYTQIQARNNVEGLKGISFSYTPSPKQIKDTSNNQIGIQLGNNSHFYLNDDNKGIEIDLDDNFDYEIKIKSYNGITDDLTLSLKDSSNNFTPIVLKGDIISKASGKIKSKIVDSKNEEDSIHSLFVNDILGK